MLIATILFLLAAGASGLRLGVAGIPYAPLMMTIHTLSALLATATAVFFIIHLLGPSGPNGFLIGFYIVSALLAALLFLSGALLTIGKAREEPWRMMHTAASVVLAAGLLLAFALFLLDCIHTN